MTIRFPNASMGIEDQTPRWGVAPGSRFRRVPMGLLAALPLVLAACGGPTQPSGCSRR